MSFTDIIKLSMTFLCGGWIALAAAYIVLFITDGTIIDDPANPFNRRCIIISGIFLLICGLILKKFT